MGETLRRVNTRWVRQNEPGVTKEWFRSPGGDLLVRRVGGRDGEVIGFDLTFDGPAGTSETYCVVWERGGPARTGVVDMGEQPGRHPMTPTVRYHRSAEADVAALAVAFLRDPRRRLPARVRDFVLGRMGMLRD